MQLLAARGIVLQIVYGVIDASVNIHTTVRCLGPYKPFPLADASPPSLSRLCIYSTAYAYCISDSPFNPALGQGFGRPTATQRYHIRAVTVPCQSIWRRVHAPSCATLRFSTRPCRKVLPSDFRSPPSKASCQSAKRSVSFHMSQSSVLMERLSCRVKAVWPGRGRSARAKSGTVGYFKVFLRKVSNFGCLRT